MAPIPQLPSADPSSTPSDGSGSGSAPGDDGRYGLPAGTKAMIAIAAIVGAVLLVCLAILAVRRLQCRRSSVTSLRDPNNTWTEERRREMTERRMRHIEEQQEAQEKALSSASSMVSDRRPSDPFATPATEVSPCSSPPARLQPLALNSPFKQEHVVGEMERASQEVLNESLPSRASSDGSESYHKGPAPSILSDRRPSDTSTLCQEPLGKDGMTDSTDSKVEEVIPFPTTPSSDAP